LLIVLASAGAVSDRALAGAFRFGFVEHEHLLVLSLGVRRSTARR
jgi:hypothetical protein